MDRLGAIRRRLAGLAGAARKWGAGRGSRLALLAALLSGTLLGAWALWPRARAFAIEIRDERGMELVEGYAPWIEAAARESGVDPYLIAAVMFMESRGRGGQTSHAGAVGLMQLTAPAIADAARRLGLEGAAPSLETVRDDDRLNIRLGAAHLAWLLEHRGDWSLEAVLVSYNAGRARLQGWIEREGSYQSWRRREWQRHQAGERTTGTLEYATGVLAKMKAFAERGVVRPVEGVESLR